MSLSPSQAAVFSSAKWVMIITRSLALPTCRAAKASEAIIFMKTFEKHQALRA